MCYQTSVFLLLICLLSTELLDPPKNLERQKGKVARPTVLATTEVPSLAGPCWLQGHSGGEIRHGDSGR